MRWSSINNTATCVHYICLFVHLLSRTRYAVVFNVDIVGVSPMSTQPSNSALRIKEDRLTDDAGTLSITPSDGFMVYD